MPVRHRDNMDKINIKRPSCAPRSRFVLFAEYIHVYGYLHIHIHIYPAHPVYPNCNHNNNKQTNKDLELQERGLKGKGLLHGEDCVGEGVGGGALKVKSKNKSIYVKHFCYKGY